MYLHNLLQTCIVQIIGGEQDHVNPDFPVPWISIIFSFTFFCLRIPMKIVLHHFLLKLFTVSYLLSVMHLTPISITFW